VPTLSTLPDATLAEGHVLAPYGGGWHARLALDIALRDGRSVAARLAHAGPLRVQKLLWPEGPRLAHVILLHPPSGLAAGDSLVFDLALGPQAELLLTTPGAGRWYRADAPATQTVTVTVAEGAHLEWLPQETILHDGVSGDQAMRVDIAGSASAVGMEVLVLGRRASGERLTQARFHGRLSLWRAGRLLYDEASRIDGAQIGAAALGARHVSGLLWAVSPEPFPEGLADAIEADLDATLAAPAGTADAPAIGGASRVEPHLLLVRVVGSSPQTVRGALVAAWARLRPLLRQREAVPPRIWMT
jgi:urease accessory protein